MDGLNKTIFVGDKLEQLSCIIMTNKMTEKDKGRFFKAQINWFNQSGIMFTQDGNKEQTVKRFLLVIKIRKADIAPHADKSEDEIWNLVRKIGGLDCHLACNCCGPFKSN